MLHFRLTELSVCLVHVADDDRYMLKPTIVATGINGDRPSFWYQVFRQLDELVAEPHSYHPHSQAEHAFQVLVVFPGDFRIRYLLKCEHLGVKIDGPVHVGDRDPYGVYALDERVALCGGMAGECQQGK